MVHDRIKILHLEDRQTDAELVAWELKKAKINPEIFVVPDKARFINALKNFSYDVILSDHSLASFDSSEALKLVRAAGIAVPFILVTAAMSDEFAAQIIKEGAWDYILKDRLHRLPSAVISSIEKHDLEERRDAELQRANEETKQLSIRLQLATKSAGMGIWEWDIKNKYLSWDEGMYRLYNIDSVQFGSIYEGWMARLHPDDKDRVNTEIEMAVAGKKKYDTEFRIIWDDGSARTLRATGIVEKDAAGNPARMIGANWDISEKKAAELRLIESLAFNSGVLNSLTSHIAVIDRQGKIVAVNEPWRRFGIENGTTELERTIVESNYFEVCERSAKLGDETAAKALKGMKEVMAGKINVFYQEYQCSGPQIEQWFAMRVSKFESYEAMIVVSHADISERKLAERNLLNSESRLKEAQAIAHVGNFELDLIKNSPVWSDEMFIILGITKTETTPSIYLALSFVHADDRNRLQEGLDECFRAFQGAVFEFRFIRSDGALRYARAELRFEFDINQKPVRLFGIFQDVSESKLAAMELAKIMDELIARNNDLEQFAYIISHNLRAPVANIIGLTNALNDAELDAEDHITLTKGINTSVTRLDDVIKDLNYILQVKSEINAVKETVNFSDLIEQIKNSVRNLIDGRGITITHDFSEADSFFTLKSYMHSIFYNLISNSIEYRRPNVATVIEIRSRLLKNKLELTFADNGMGINLEKSGSQVFGLYKRFHQDIGGKGFGLFMVKTQVEKLGGKITVNSKEGEGTLFKIEFEI